MATPINTPLTGEIWHLSIDDLLATPMPSKPRLGGAGPFVINLSASTAPISKPPKAIEACPNASVYQIQRMEDHRLRFRLRLGPFATEDEAEAVLEQVRDLYPSALTATADADDMRVIDSIQAKLGATRKPEKTEQSESPERAKKPAPAAAPPEAPLASPPPPRPAPTPVLSKGVVPVKPAKGPVEPAPIPISRSAAPPPRAFAAASIPTLTSVHQPVRASSPPRAPIVPSPAPPATAVPTATPAAPATPAASTPAAPAKPPGPPAPSIAPVAPAPPAVEAAPRAVPENRESPAPAPRPSIAPVPPAPPAAQAAAAIVRPVAKLSTPLPSIESTQTLRPITRLELESDDASRWFVIQLAIAEQAFDPDALPNLDIFGEYRLYCVAGLDQGRLIHALRLGFFGEAVAAGAVASYLAAYYEHPTVKRVSAAERERFSDQRVEARKDIGATGCHAVIEITDERVVREKRSASVSMLPTTVNQIPSQGVAARKR